MFDQSRQVLDIFSNAPLTGRAFTSAVTAPVIGQDARMFGQAWNDRVPGVVRCPGSMQKDQGDFAAALEFIIELNTVYMSR
jgi:hypothetical protein